MWLAGGMGQEEGRRGKWDGSRLKRRERRKRRRRKGRVVEDEGREGRRT